MTDTATDAAAATEAEPVDRRKKNELEEMIRVVTNKIASGEINLGEGGAATPHRLAQEVKTAFQLEKAPSAGAVTANLQRWKEVGFIDTTEGPFAFVGYTEEGREQGLNAMKAASRARKSAAHAAAKAAAAPAPAPAESESDPAEQASA